MTEIATALIGAVHQAGGTITLDGADLRLEAPAPLSEILLISLRQHKPALVTFLTENPTGVTVIAPLQRTAHHSAPSSQLDVSESGCAMPANNNPEPQRTAHHSSPSWQLNGMDSGCIGVQLKTRIGSYRRKRCGPRCAVGGQDRHPAYPVGTEGNLTWGCAVAPALPVKPASGTVANSALSALYPPCPAPKTPPLPIEPGLWSFGIPDDVACGIGAMLVASAATGIPDRAWPQIVADTMALADGGQIAQAFTLGWTAADLFGCDRRAPWHRLDRAGLMLLVAGRQIDLEADHAALRHPDGSVLRFRRAQKPHEPPVAMLWHLLPKHLRPQVGPAP